MGFYSDFRAVRGIASTVLATVALATPALADSLLEKATSDGLTVAYYNYNPDSYINAEGELVGTSPEILAAVLEVMGGKMGEVQDTEWGNLIPGLNAGRFDVVAAGMYITPERCGAVAFSEPIFGVANAMAVPVGNPKGITTPESVAEMGLKVAVIAGSAHVGYSESAGIDSANILELPDTASAIAAVRAGRADAIMIDAGGIRNLVSSVPEADFEMSDTFSTVGGELAMPHGAFAFRKDDAEFVAAFNEALAEIAGSEAHIAILASHGLTPDELPQFSAAQLCGE